MHRFGYQISLILVILVFISCHRPPEFPETPNISFGRLHLTDTSTLILDFNIRDGNGDIGLASEDLFEPYHIYSFIVQNDTTVNISNNYDGPFDVVRVALIPTSVNLFKGLNELDEPIFESQSILIPVKAGVNSFFSDEDLRPAEFECEQYEIVSFYAVAQVVENGFVVSESLIENVDTVFVQRNPFHFNINIDLLVKDGSNYIPYQEFVPEFISACDPLFTSRFPIFDRSDIGRPLDGSISYAFFSTQFATDNSVILNETLRLRFSIYDRALNQSNVVETEDFTILGLRSGDLVGN